MRKKERQKKHWKLFVNLFPFNTVILIFYDKVFLRKIQWAHFKFQRFTTTLKAYDQPYLPWHTHRKLYEFLKMTIYFYTNGKGELDNLFYCLYTQEFSRKNICQKASALCSQIASKWSIIRFYFSGILKVDLKEEKILKKVPFENIFSKLTNLM